MLVPSAFMQSMSAFAAQNIGAGKFDRAKKTLDYGILISFVFGAVMSLLTFLFRAGMTGIFTQDTAVIAGGADHSLSDHVPSSAQASGRSRPFSRQ